MDTTKHTVTISGQDYLDFIEAKKTKERYEIEITKLNRLNFIRKHLEVISKIITIDMTEGLKGVQEKDLTDKSSVFNKEPKEARLINDGTNKPKIIFTYE